jgi:hypothetical protein
MTYKENKIMKIAEKETIKGTYHQNPSQHNIYLIYDSGRESQ